MRNLSTLMQSLLSSPTLNNHFGARPLKSPFRLLTCFVSMKSSLIYIYIYEKTAFLFSNNTIVSWSVYVTDILSPVGNTNSGKNGVEIKQLSIANCNNHLIYSQFGFGRCRSVVKHNATMWVCKVYRVVQCVMIHLILACGVE